jgi:hypothetical protein
MGSYVAENVLRWALPARPSWIAKRLAPELGVAKPKPKAAAAEKAAATAPGAAFKAGQAAGEHAQAEVAAKIAAHGARLAGG